MRKTDIRMFARIASAMSAALLSQGIGSRTALLERNPRSTGYFRQTGKELRDPSNPNQQARIQAAAAKRERRAKKLARDSRMSRLCNPCNHVTLSDVMGESSVHLRVHWAKLLPN